MDLFQLLGKYTGVYFISIYTEIVLLLQLNDSALFGHFKLPEKKSGWKDEVGVIEKNTNRNSTRINKKGKLMSVKLKSSE